MVTVIYTEISKLIRVTRPLLIANRAEASYYELSLRDSVLKNYDCRPVEKLINNVIECFKNGHVSIILKKPLDCFYTAL